MGLDWWSIIWFAVQKTSIVPDGLKNPVIFGADLKYFKSGR
jgi:hypothetical protein